MTTNSQAGFVWQPLHASRPRRWSSIGIVVAAVLMGFVAGKISSFVNPRSAPQSVASAAHSMAQPAASAKPVTARATPTAGVAQQRPMPYVVINPGTTIDVAADDRRGTIGHRNGEIIPTEAKASAAPSSPLTEKARTAISSKMKQARSRRRLTAPAPDYRSLREYVLKQ
jgi:hypothetical protein